MLRLVFSLVFWVVLARWGYEEVKLLSPEVIPAIDAALEQITPTTHDKWPKLVYQSTEDGVAVQIIPPQAEQKATKVELPEELEVEKFRAFLAQLK